MRRLTIAMVGDSSQHQTHLNQLATKSLCTPRLFVRTAALVPVCRPNPTLKNMLTHAENAHTQDKASIHTTRQLHARTYTPPLTALASMCHPQHAWLVMNARTRINQHVCNPRLCLNLRCHTTPHPSKQTHTHIVNTHKLSTRDPHTVLPC